MARRSISRDFPVTLPEDKSAVDFSEFDALRVAIILECADCQVVFCGVAQFQRDDRLGRILRIRSIDDEPGDPDVVLTERDWKGRIIPDFEYGCEFCFIPPQNG